MTSSLAVYMTHIIVHTLTFSLTSLFFLSNDVGMTHDVKTEARREACSVARPDVIHVARDETSCME